MPAFDPTAALRLIANNRMRTAQGWGVYRDLRGALAVTSDAPIAALNCIGDFDTTGDQLDGLLDVGFALLRAFDCAPAAEITPLDRPADIAANLERRGLQLTERRSWMTFAGDRRVAAETPTTIAINHDVRVRVADGDDVLTFGNLHGGSERWVRRLSKASMFEAMLHAGNTFYLGLIEGQPVATLHLLIDHGAFVAPAPTSGSADSPTTNDQRPAPTAGIYAVGTMRSYRNRGIASTMIARAIHDARAAGCDLIGLSTDYGGAAERLYTRLGFAVAFESQLWVEPERPVEPSKIRRRRKRKPRT